jgi:hypothetical protein
MNEERREDEERSEQSEIVNEEEDDEEQREEEEEEEKSPHWCNRGDSNGYVLRSWDEQEERKKNHVLYATDVTLLVDLFMTLSLSLAYAYLQRTDTTSFSFIGFDTGRVMSARIQLIHH